MDTATCTIAGLITKAQLHFLDYRSPKLGSLLLTVKAICVGLNQQLCKQMPKVDEKLPSTTGSSNCHTNKARLQTLLHTSSWQHLKPFQQKGVRTLKISLSTDI